MVLLKVIIIKSYYLKLLLIDTIKSYDEFHISLLLMVTFVQFHRFTFPYEVKINIFL